MDQKLSIFDYLAQVFMIFGITTVLLNLFCLLFGESAREVSAIFSLGSEGVGVLTSFQFLLAIGLITILRVLFMTDHLVKKMSLTVRVIFLFTGAFIIILTFIVVCRWIPADVPAAWVLFIVCFAVSCTVSTLISMLHEKQENKKLAEALQKMKEEA